MRLLTDNLHVVNRFQAFQLARIPQWDGGLPLKLPEYRRCVRIREIGYEGRIGAMVGMDYIVYGVDADGMLHELERTPAARIARAARDMGGSRWVGMEVVSSDGELSVDELNLLSDRGHRYA